MQGGKEASLAAADARRFWQQLEQQRGGRQPRQLEGQATPGGARGAGCAVPPPPHSSRVRAAWALFGQLAPLSTQAESGAELAALTAPRRPRRAAGARSADGGRAAANSAAAEQRASGAPHAGASEGDLAGYGAAHHEGASDEGLAGGEVTEQCTVVDVQLQGARDEAQGDTKAEVQEGAGDEDLADGAVTEQCAASDVQCPVARDEAQGATRATGGLAVQSAGQDVPSGGLAMRTPRSRLRWADDESDDAFDASDMQSEDSGTASDAPQGPEAAGAIDIDARLDAMNAAVAQARAAQFGGGALEPLELAVQACVVFATGSAEFETRVVRVAAQHYVATVQVAATPFVGPVAKTDEQARYGALHVALDELVTALRGLQRRLYRLS